MTLRILAVGDIHLGRRPGSVPAGVASSRVDLDALGPYEAWSRTVEAALNRDVNAVLLLGDVVNEEKDYVEGWTALQAGMNRLLAAGIEVVAVAGNHDVLVLPKLAGEVKGLHLLGAGGRWQEMQLGNGAARLVGWSYPTAHVKTDPTEDPALARLCETRSTVPTIGLLHGDLDTGPSKYAHFKSAKLKSLGADVWLLGHVHKPSFASDGADRIPVGHLGSLTGLDPTETGVHGPWLLTFEGRSLEEVEHLPLAPLRWDRIALDVDPWTDAGDLEVGITSTLSAFAEGVGSELGDANAVGLKIELRGRSRIHRELRPAIEGFDLGGLRTTLDGRVYFVDSLIDSVRPDLDLEAHAASSDPPGLLAQRLLALDAPTTATYAELLRLARSARTTVAGRREFLAVSGAEPTDRELVAAMRAAGLAALEDLLATRQDPEKRT